MAKSPAHLASDERGIASKKLRRALHFGDREARGFLIPSAHGYRPSPAGRHRSAEGGADRRARLAKAASAAEAELAAARARASDDQALIAHLKLQIAKLQRQLFGPHSERTRRLLDQLELQLEELEASATEDEIAAEMAAAKTTTVAAFTRKRPARSRFPTHLPRERVVEPAPCACPAAAVRVCPSWARTSPRRWR